MRLAPGARLGPYVVDELLGSGGMGEVYRARDTRLGRSVAIKVLPEDLARDETLLGRLLREARAASQLAHPGILAIHDVGEHEGTHFLVSELLEGETLRRLLQRGPLAPRRAVEIARQVAEGLAAAHAKGIVHRDLKPENLFVTHDGRVKILDFGLARLMGRPGDEDSAGMQGSTVEHATRPGTVLGTYGYMSPEQARGEPADARSDVFALGAVLYEMLSGSKAFARDTPAETLAAVLREDLRDLSELDARVPPRLARIVARCLEKDRDRRFQAARDVAFALDDQSGSSASGLAGARVASRRRLLTALAVAVVAAALVAAALTRRPPPQVSPAFHLITHHRGEIGVSQFTHDGRGVVFGGSFGDDPRDVHVVDLGDELMRSLAIGDAEVWDVSKNGELAVGLPIGEWRTLARVPLSGGVPRQVAVDCIWGAWMPDGEQLAAIKWPPSVQVPIGSEVYAASNDWLHHLRVHPDGTRACFIAHVGVRSVFAVIVVDARGIQRTIAEGKWMYGGAAWSPDGREILTTIQRTSGTVLAAYSLGGEERELCTMPGKFFLADAAQDGRLLMRHDHARYGVRVVQGDGAPNELSSHAQYHVTGVSADGRHVLYTAMEPPRMFVARSDGSSTRDLGPGFAHCFSPDGTRVLFAPLAGDDLAIIGIEGGAVERIAPLYETRSPAPWGRAFHGWLEGDLLVTRDLTESPVVRALRGGPTRRVTTDRITTFPVSSLDGRELVAWSEHVLTIYPVDGGPPRAVPGALPVDRPVRWLRDGGLLVEEKSDTRRLVRIDFATGERSLLRELGPWRYGVVRVHEGQASADGRVIAYGYEEGFDELYVVSGLR